MKKILMAWFVVVFAVMLGLTIWASLESNVIEGFKQVGALKWGLATFFDTYFGFIAFWLWVAWKERGGLRAILWLLAILALGNFAIAGYMLAQLGRWNERKGVEALLTARR